MRFAKKLGLLLTIYILLGISAKIAMDCSWICLPVAIVISGAGLVLLDYYAEHYDRFNE